VVVDALFGVILLLVAFGGNLSIPSAAPAGPAPTTSTALVARLGGVSPPGQSTGFAVAADGSLAVVDRSRQVVIRLDANGQPQAEWGPRFGSLEAKDLVGIAPDGDGWYVLDRGAQRIVRLDSRGQAQSDRTINLEPLAVYGPNGLATDAHGNLYMADTGLDRVMIFDSNGHLTGTLGGAGTDIGKFKQPMFLAFAPDGSMLVTDWENSRIERFDANRKATNAWQIPVHAWGIAIDPMGRAFVPDGDHHAVRMFGPDGAVLAQLGGDGATPIPVEFPSQVGLSPDGGRLWVLGSNGLAQVDLSPYAALHPSAVGQPARTPLAVLGGLLLLIAAAVTFGPRLIPSGSELRAPTQIAPVLVGKASPVEVDTATGPRGRRATIGLALAFVGAVAAGIAEVFVADPLARIDPWPRLAALAAASLLFAIGAALSARARPWRWVTAWPGCPDATPRRTRLTALAGGAATGLLAGVAAYTWWQGGFQTPDALRGAYIWAAALLISVGTLVYYSRSRFARPTVWTLLPWLLFALALAPRAWHNADLPYGVWFDEAEAGLQARKYLQEGRFTPITDTYGRDASLFYYFIGVAQTFIADPVVAARLVSAFVGALCAPLMYFLGRELFGWRVGLAAALVLATSRWHLDVSRLGWDPISLPLCAILAIWLLARAVRTERWTDIAWAGLAVGLGLHGYIGARTLPVVGLGMILYAGLIKRWPVPKLAGRFGLLAAAAVVAGLPVVVFAIQDPAGFNGRLNQTLILNEPVSQAQKLDELWSNTQKHGLMFHIVGDMNGRHNLPGAPMLDPLSGLLMVVGLAVLVSRPFDWRSVVLLGWGVVSMAGGIFTYPFEAPQGMRTLGVTPVLALLIAVGLWLVLDRLAVLVRHRIAHRALAATSGLAVAWIGVSNVNMFFTRQMTDPTVWESFSTRETIPSRVLLEAGRPLEAILGSPTIAPSLQQQLMVPRLQQIIRSFDASTDLPYRGNGAAVIILETEHDAGLAEEVARYYPEAVRRPIIPPNGTRPTVDEVFLEPNVLAAHHGLATTSAGWRGGLALNAPGEYRFRVSVGFTLGLDAAQLRETDRVQLARGNHLLVVTGPPGPTPELSWWPPGATTWQTIDDRALFVAPEGGNGLEATFYPTPDWQGSPTETLIDPVLDHYYHVNPLARLNLSPPTWSVEWRGTLDVPTAGTYRFEPERLSRAGLWIDAQTIFDDTQADDPASGLAQLTAGRHEIRVRLQNRGDGGPRLYLYWIPPGGGREVVPGRVLYPPPPKPTQ
jgi:hypothetical protein